MHQHAEALIRLQHEMGGSGKHSFEGREPLAHERRHFAQRPPLDEQQQIVRAAHQVSRAHLGKAPDTLRDGVKAPLALWGHLHLDDRGDLLQVELVLIEDGLVAADDPALFILGNPLADFGRRDAQHAGDVFTRLQRVGLQYSQQFVHK